MKPVERYEEHAAEFERPERSFNEAVKEKDNFTEESARDGVVVNKKIRHKRHVNEFHWGDPCEN